jgi:hypothetical protein
MIHDIKPIFVQGHNCFFAILPSILYYAKLDYRRLFAYDYNLNYVNRSKFIGENLYVDASLYENLLYEKYNINLKKTYRTNNRLFFKRIIDAIDNNKVVVIQFSDHFYCPTFPSYHTFHKREDHFALVIGYDEENLIFIDPYLSEEKHILSKEDLVAGVNEITILPIKIKYKNENIYDIFNSSIDFIDIDKIKRAIIDFKYDIENKMDINLEFENFKIDAFKVPMFTTIRDIEDLHKCYIYFLKYIYTNINNIKLNAIINQIEIVIGKWNIIRCLFIKSCTSKYTENTKKKISYILEDIAESEWDICRNLKNINNNIDKNKKKIVLDVEYPNKNDLKKCCLNLSDYCNNKAFGTSFSKAYESDMTGVGDFIVENDIKTKLILKDDKNNFIFKLCLNNYNDNVICMGQKILVNESYYSGISILACSEYGTRSGKMTSTYNDNTLDEILFEASDLMVPVSDNYIVMYEGKWASIENDKVVISKQPVYLYAKNYKVNKNKEMIAITLPKTPFLHIFAITLI